MGKSLYLGTYLGIPIYVHWTFGFIGLFIIYVAVKDSLSLQALTWFCAYILTLFICVILHEFGHALAARKYGVSTKDIIISPIGGVARLESMPKKAWKEMVIAIAGPLVNVLIAAILILAFYTIFGFSFTEFDELDLTKQNFEGYLRLVIFLNIVLLVFNLIPAFPMDGGRILRALLSMKWGKLKATKIASYIGKFIASLFIILAFWLTSPTLAFVGLFVFYMANAEYKQILLQSRLQSTIASEIMNANYPILYHEDKLEKAVQLYNAGQAKNFLIFDESSKIVGAIPEQFILSWLKKPIKLENQISSFMTQAVETFEWDESLEILFQQMNTMGLAVVGIKKGDQIIGMIDRHIFNSFLNGKT